METKTNALILRIAVQVAEMNSPERRQVAAKIFGVEPDELSSNQRAEVYGKSGRMEEMGKLFSEETFKAVEKSLGHDPLQLSQLECLRALWKEFSQTHPEVKPPLPLERPELLAQ